MAEHQFEDFLTKQDFGFLNHHYLTIPPEVADDFASRDVRRVIASFNGKEYRRAINGRKDGEKLLILGNSILRDLKLKMGDRVKVILRDDPNPDEIELGEEFEEVLEQDDEAAARWATFTPGKQRGLCYYINSGKRVETRIKRALEIAEKIRTHTLYGDKPKYSGGAAHGRRPLT